MKRLYNLNSPAATLDKRYWKVIGSGPIGRMAEQIREKTPAIVEAGFTLIPRIILSANFITTLKKRKQFNTEQEATIDLTLRKFEGLPIALVFQLLMGKDTPMKIALF